jgi:hypothetical protein
MKTFHLSMADNVGAWKKWHDTKHAGPWASCIWEPCSVTETQFREVWSK